MAVPGERGKPRGDRRAYEYTGVRVDVAVK
jgi:hypothetical protein